MTKRRGPKRGPDGHFLKGDAQRGDREERPAGRRCEECGRELEETRVRIRGHVLYVLHCPRCTPDPVQVMTE